MDRQQLLLDYVTSSKLKTFVEVTIATSVRQGVQNLLLVYITIFGGKIIVERWVGRNETKYIDYGMA